MRNPFLPFLFLLLFSTGVKSQYAAVYMDLQIHPTMHFPYSFFGNGLTWFDSLHPPKLTYKHQFKNVNYANYLHHNKGARIIVNGALTGEWVRSEKRARKLILEQISYVNEFAAANSEYFVVAKTPAEVRALLDSTDKTIIIHSIEGGKKLIRSQEDADFWASQGVAFITLMHLVDSEYGSAGILPKFPTTVMNLTGFFTPESERGLTDLGKNAILWLANAGIMTDITHMSDQTRQDALDLMQEHGILPLSTHEGFKPLQNSPRALSENNILQIYKNNGLVSLPVSGTSLIPFNPDFYYAQRIRELPCYCEGSIDSYKFTYLQVKNVIENNLHTFPATEGKTKENLTEQEWIQLAIGFQSDFNGWLDHSRPRYGKDGCYDVEPDSCFTELETVGLAHPGLLDSYWKLLEKEGVDLRPIRRASEKFLQMWEYMLARKGKFIIAE